MRVELFIASLLRLGVILSFLIVATGVIAVMVTGQTGYGQGDLDDLRSLITYRPENPPFPYTLDQVLSGILALKPYAIISLGLLVLIAIPVIRVAASIIAFAVQGDWLYVGITAYVLSMLLLSFAIGKAGE